MTLKSIIWAVSLCLLSVSLSIITYNKNTYATQRSVPGSYSTIQSAINASRDGDEVVVSPGIYRENITILKKYITVRSTGDVDNTIIAGNPGRSPVIITEVPFRNGSKMVLSGFKITSGNSPAGHGGAVTIYNNSDPIIENNKIENNYANTGGGVLIYNNSNPLIRNNIIRNNTAYSFGGGIFAVRSSSPTIVGNQITGNSAYGDAFPNGGPSGGGIYLENENTNQSLRSYPTVANNTISNNSANFAGGAIAVMVGVNATIEGNTIDSNTAPYGGAIHLETHGSSPKIVSNEITSNVASYNAAHAGSGHGGGIAVYAWSNPIISDNLIKLNRSSSGGAGVVVAEGASPTIERNTIEANSAVDSGAEGGGIYVAQSTAAIMNNILDGNEAHLGGGIGLLNNSNTTIINNTLIKNKARQSLGGGGLFISNDSNTKSSILNNIFSDNEKYQIFEDSVKMKIENNHIKNSGLGIYYSYAAHAITTATALNNSSSINAANNIDGDPQFVNNLNQDYKLLSSSPARGVGQATSLYDDRDLYVRTTNDAGAYTYRDGSSIQKLPVYRFWSTSYSGHFYTISKDERNSIFSTYQPSVWRYENTAYYAYSQQLAGTVPVYRFWSNTFSGHFYTIDSSEKDYISTTYPPDVWKYEGVAYYVYPPSYSGPVAIKNAYRFWSDTYRHHFYTTDESEKTYVQSSLNNIWNFEGYRFSVPR